MSAFDVQNLRENLEAVVTAGSVEASVPMAELTTFKIGGPVSILVEPANVSEAVEVLKFCNAEGVELRVIGCGSNILASDAGLDCVLMKFGQKMNAISIKGNMITALAGATNEEVAAAAQAQGLAGYEFASGIPGTVGGAAIMNAGAYDGEFKDVAVNIACLDKEGQLIKLTCEEADFGYRHSKMMDEGLVVIAATLELHEDDPDAIQARMDDLKERRESKQPLEMPSAGSTFKRPEGYFAGKLIQDAGLKGYRVGGAMVSEKHSGFVVNAGGATAADVCQLIQDVHDKVYDMEGVHMEPEVRMWGFDK